MRINPFEQLISSYRFSRYKMACNNDTRKAMTLYRYNIKLSQELFSIISVFEVILRNKIDSVITDYNTINQDWLRDSCHAQGIFDNNYCGKTKEIIKKQYDKLNQQNKYSHEKLIAELNFGLWTNLFQRHQFNTIQYQLNRNISQICAFPSIITFNNQHPYTHIPIKWDNNNQIDTRSSIHEILSEINKLRNRIAHHEPVCFNRRQRQHTQKDTYYAKKKYRIIIDTLQFMNINTQNLLYGIDHVIKICDKINSL